MSSRATSETLQAARLLYELTRRDEVRVTIANRPAILRNHSVGSVRLPSGKLCACDPITSAYDAVAFERQVAPGTYPVEVFVAEFEDNDDQRVAAALVHLASARADDWEDALWPGQDASTLGADGFYGYPVDAGTGCLRVPRGWRNSRTYSVSTTTTSRPRAWILSAPRWKQPISRPGAGLTSRSAVPTSSRFTPDLETAHSRPAGGSPHPPRRPALSLTFL